MPLRSNIPRVQNPPAGDGHHITTRYMTATELAERDARQTAYEDMLARQQAYENRLIKQPIQVQPETKGCVFAKSCKLPDGVINHASNAGFIPVEKLADFGELALLGGRERDALGNIPLKRIGGSNLPTTVGTLALGTLQPNKQTGSSSIRFTHRSTRILFWCFRLTQGCRLCMLCFQDPLSAVISSTTGPR